MISSVHLQKQKLLNRLVQDKIEMEDFKLKEYFPLKLFDILEEKLQAKEIPCLGILCQTKYFKKLLEQTYNMRKEQQLKAAKELDASVTSESKTVITIDLVEQRMVEVAEFLDKQLSNFNSEEKSRSFVFAPEKQLATPRNQGNAKSSVDILPKDKLMPGEEAKSKELKSAKTIET